MIFQVLLYRFGRGNPSTKSRESFFLVFLLDSVFSPLAYSYLVFVSSSRIGAG